MYLLALLAVIASGLIMAVSSAEGIGILINYLDFYSLLILLVICIPVLVSAGLFKDFNRAFSIALNSKRKSTLLEMRRAHAAVELVRKTILYAGMFAMFFSLLIIYNNAENIEIAAKNLGVAGIVVIYAAAINLLLLPISTRIKIKELDFMHKEE